ncbi:hypothetical protein [Limnofasciculus baicalensis]|uniref:Uncharacterized protein n=1 Tax=Limnofasciculus baicalensis BBK-W-15 TaxID=2699891 RepID=A0AAE3GVA8_9CYAN|nr:hypothetical protein [Limnofasciculus baicalensis]MCP2731336.1 hypothetical protein [Limnofasciculus baicalensis BBK-W-15]
MINERNLYNVVGTVSIALVSVIANAGDIKVMECNQLIGSINELEPVVAEFVNKSDQLGDGFKKAKDLDEIQQLAGESAQEFNRFAGELDSITQDIKLINLTDKQLNSLKNRYAQTGEDLSQGIRDMAQVLISLTQVEVTQEGLEQLNTIESDIDSIGESLDSAGDASDKIVDQINSYCGAK